jgi:hypothetical protein
MIMVLNQKLTLIIFCSILSEDYPEFSPDLFVLCVGFEQADFISECHKTNLPITSLLKSSSQTYSSDCSFMEHITSFNMGSKVAFDITYLDIYDLCNDEFLS